MDSLKLFLKENKIQGENVQFAATESLRDENGAALLWELRRLSTEEDERIREECTAIRGSAARIDYGLYMKKVAAASVVYPPLFNAALQDSYGVKTPEELIVKLIDSPGEYQEFIRFVQRLNGFEVKMSERVERAKN